MGYSPQCRKELDMTEGTEHAQMHIHTHTYRVAIMKVKHRECRRHKRCRFDPWVGKIPWRRKWQPTPVLLPGESHGRSNLVGYRPWDLKELDMTGVTELMSKN